MKQFYFWSCQIYLLDNELSGAHRGRYWRIHLISFSLAKTKTSKKKKTHMILIALLLLLYWDWLLWFLLPDSLPAAGLGVRPLSNSLKPSDRLSLPVLYTQPFSWSLISSCYWIFRLEKNSSICMLLASSIWMSLAVRFAVEQVVMHKLAIERSVFLSFYAITFVYSAEWWMITFSHNLFY